jgi:hypothetical protein
VDSDSIEGLARNWKQAQAIEVLPYSPGEADQVVTVRVAGHTEPLRFQVGRGEGYVRFSRPDLAVAYHVAPNVAEGLLGLKGPGPDTHPGHRDVP